MSERRVAVSCEDLSLAFDFVASGSTFEHRAFVSRDDGKIYWLSDGEPVGDEDGVPDTLESDDFLELPHKNDLDLGHDLVFRFVAEELPNHYDRIERFFRGPGAYGRFKDLLEAENRLEQWYAFEAEAVKAALEEWCADNGIRLTYP